MILKLITLIVCLAIQRIANIGGTFGLALLDKYLKILQKIVKKLGGWLGLAIAIIPFLLILGFLHIIVAGRLYGLAQLLLMLFVLFFSVDMRDQKDALKNYFTAMDNKEIDKASEAASEFAQGAISKKTHALPREISKTIFNRNFTLVFAPIFWFILFNIYGAAFYCLIVNFRKNSLKIDTSFAKAASKIEDILNWIPMRLVALTYALAGHFSTGFSYCYKKVLSISMETEFFIVNTGLEALDIDWHDATKSEVKENHAVLSLVDRSLLIWLVALVLFSLGKLLT